MKKIIRMNLTDAGLKKAIRELKEFESRLITKTELFCSKLADIGIQTARQNTGVIDDLGNVSSLVNFTKEVNPNKYGCTALMIGADAMEVMKAWLDSEGKVKTARVSAIDMYEFGSGSRASAGQSHVDIVNPKHDVGQGTFPNQTHAFDAKGWYWKDLNGEWQHSYGIKPTMPMYKAFWDMYYQIDRVKREVFK